MRTLVIGDIHGAHKALLQILEKAKVTPEDTLIFLGDYVDGWSEPYKVIQELIKLRGTNNCIFIRGNHDELFLEWFRDQKHNPMWLQHGGKATANAYKNINDLEKTTHIDFLERLTNYHLDEQKRLFLHAGFTNMHGVQREYFPEMCYWDRTLWEMALVVEKIGLEKLKGSSSEPERLAHYNEIYIGHTPVTRLGKTTPVKAANVWNIDTGAAFKGPLSIMDIDSKELWQSDPVYQLYSDEQGRN